MVDINLGYAVLGATVLVLSLAAAPIKRQLWLSEPLVATLVGVLLGPALLGAFDPLGWQNSNFVLGELARLTLAISLMGVALRLPHNWVRRNGRSLAVLLVAGMPLMWIVSSLCAWLLLESSLLHALLIGAILTPTDPVAASSIVTGKLAEDFVDADVRHLISAESGANDGLAFLLLMLPVLVAERGVSGGLWHWLIVVLCVEVLGSVLLGALVGFACGRLFVVIDRKQAPHRGSLMAVSGALALVLLGVTAKLGGDGILAVFAAGLTFNWATQNSERQAYYQRLQETIDRFFDVPVFVLFGMLLPWQAWEQVGWLGVGFVGVLLLVRRLPIVLALSRFLVPIKTRRDALFTGWFGPIAVAAIVYGTWVREHDSGHGLWPIVSLSVFASIVVHGVVATPLTRWYGVLRGGREQADPARPANGSLAPDVHSGQGGRQLPVPFNRQDCAMTENKETNDEREYGEGNYKAGKDYQEAVRETAGTNESEDAAQRAKRARQSPEERAELDRAERRGKEPARGVSER